MKKFFTFLSFVLVLTGCSIGDDMSNTPTKRVEEYLNSNINSWNYQRLEKADLSKEIEPLFIRYDKSKIEKERDLLRKWNNRKIKILRFAKYVV